MLTCLSLCYSKVDFKWIHEEKVQFHFDKGFSLSKRLEFFLGKQNASSMLPLEEAFEPFSLEGFIGAPNLHRPNKRVQFLFINGRYVTCPFISHKILEAFSTRLPTHRFPVFALHLAMPASTMDVNVHPQKKEIRLSEEEVLGKFILRAVEKALEKRNGLSAFGLGAPCMSFEFPASDRDWRSSFEKSSEARIRDQEAETSLNLQFSNQFQVIGRIGKFFLVEKMAQFFLVDIVSAKSRILYEDFLSNEEEKSMQSLLLPLSLEFSGQETEEILENLEKLQKSGISIRHFGQRTFIVDACLASMDREEIEPAIRLFLEMGTLHKIKKLAPIVKKTYASLKEAEKIIERLFCCSLPAETADGKPTFFLLTENEIESRFYGSHSKG